MVTARRGSTSDRNAHAQGVAHEFDSEEARAGRRKLAKEVRADGAKPVVDSMMPKLLAGASRIKRPQVPTFVSNMMTTTAPESLAGALEGMASRADHRDTLSKIDLSTMVVYGDQDEIIPREEMDLLARMVRGSSVTPVCRENAKSCSTTTAASRNAESGSPTLMP